ncbi:hypothetical protein AB6A40_005117 [Gnathostoma spinigerum]|uniref:Phytanoyl-CoA hydroxylase-interacting protein-like C-terminal domain-containing protein n=1 Tax=Gnathostoma spinigerum TaxID=75299 RepID=A0ABD6EEN3_9BILA
MYDENDWYYRELESRYRPVPPWVRRPRFPAPYPRPGEIPPFMRPEMGMGMGVHPFSMPRMPPDLVTPHAGPVLRARPLPRPLHPPLYQDFSAPSRPAPINMNVQVSALKCIIEWKAPIIPKQIKYTYRLEVWEGIQCDTHNFLPHILSYKVKTTPGSWYRVELTCRDQTDRVLATGRTQFKAVFSHDEMEQLHKKAVAFVGSLMHPFRILYRCKPKLYYDDIQFRCGGIMAKYLKDNNGQAASSINGTINGLFFSARLLPDGSLPTHSPFGNIRMMVPAGTLLNPERINMYFCDFYCNYITHYVTVVICEKYSETDIFCMQHLIKLNPLTNNFLRISTRPPLYEPEFWVNKNVWVEIYYTEDVPLAWGRFDTIIATGAGTSRIGGLPHNKQCQQCNLYPQKASSSSSRTNLANKVNSTFEVVLNLERQRLGTDRVDESADLIEAICSLIDAVVESSTDVNDSSEAGIELHSDQKQIKTAIEVVEMLDGIVLSEELKSVSNFLKKIVYGLEEKTKYLQEKINESMQIVERRSIRAM